MIWSKMLPEVNNKQTCLVMFLFLVSKIIRKRFWFNNKFVGTIKKSFSSFHSYSLLPFLLFLLELSSPAILSLSLFSVYSSALFVLCFFFVLRLKMSQKSTEQLCVDDVVEIDGLKDLMDEEVAEGNRPTTTFTKTSWNYMRNQLNASTRYNYPHDQLKNKFNKLRQIYKDFKKILSDMIGNGWDPLLGTINLEEEQWNELFKVNKRVKKFRKSGCSHYEKFVRIFGDTTTTDSKYENENDVASNTNVSVEENDKGKSKKQVRRNRDKFGSFFSSFLDVYAENANRNNDILDKRSFGCTSSEVDESQTSSKKDDLHEELMECLDILNTMEDVDGETYSKILKLLHGDLACRKLFLRMPDSRKRDFINSL
uniref:Myb/SANT-like domain-containing protein n=1 Tax=Cucumis melo TaxID=3656 RepID=A0A9I9E8A3_CUCME